MHFFVRANGDTLHNNPQEKAAFVRGEPPVFPHTRFDYVSYCLAQGIARVGWPDTGDLRLAPKAGSLARAYSLATVKPHVRNYLKRFAEISEGDVVLMPVSGEPIVYIGDVVKPYHYFHNVPNHPYECAHRVSVQWDSDTSESPRRYSAADLGIGTKGGFWARGFQVVEISQHGKRIIERIREVRRAR